MSLFSFAFNFQLFDCLLVSFFFFLLGFLSFFCRVFVTSFVDVWFQSSASDHVVVITPLVGGWLVVGGLCTQTSGSVEWWRSQNIFELRLACFAGARAVFVV
jgi:hypothetical protein